jgi:methyl-accepting chemotaxis protein
MTALFDAVLRPGMLGMRRMRVPLKMLLMGIGLLIPLTLLLVRSHASASESLALTRAEQSGVLMTRALTDLVVEVQTHRGLTHRALSGDASAVPLREKARERLNAAVQQVDQSFSTPAAWTSAIAAEWTAARDHALALASGRHASERSAAFAEHAAEVAALQQLTLRVGETTGLLLDPDADVFFLMDLGIARSIPWIESLARARGEGAAQLARGDAEPLERAILVRSAVHLRSQLDDLKFPMAAAQRAGVTPPASWAVAQAATQSFAKLLDTTFGTDAPPLQADAFFDRGTAAIHDVMLLNRELMAELTRRLAQRENAMTRAMWTQDALTAGGLALMAYLALAFYLSFLGDIRALYQGVLASTQGDLTHRIAIRGKDELAEIGGLVELMSERLSAMVADIRSSAVRVGLSGQQVAISGEALAQRTQAQASSLQETSGAVTQLSQAVSNNADAAKSLNELTVDLRGQAEAGGAAMRDTVNSMAALESSSRRVGEIISVIDGIAFQTNILALNAAVEAARAGDSGRGFAVVASEVRQLALRSSSASAEIKVLIGQSTQQVGEAVGRIQQVGTTLDTVVAGVRDVSDRLRGIAQASAQQSSGLADVSAAVNKLDELTKQNAEMVSESSSSADDLVTRAAALSGSVAEIRLRQGSADEAQLLVVRALDLVADKGYEAATATFRQPNSGFLDRDLYIFVIDRQGVYRVHSGNKAMEGKRVHEVPGIDGDRFVREAWAATQGEHWVEYDILNAESGKIQPKASYVSALNDRLLIGCGIYRPYSTSNSVPQSFLSA